MRDGCGGLLMPRGRRLTVLPWLMLLSRLILLPRLTLLARLRRSKRLSRDRGLVLLLARPVGLGVAGDAAEIGPAAFLTRRRRSSETALIPSDSFPSRTAAMPAATATPPATTTLATLPAFSAVGTIASSLALVAIRLDVGSRLAACRRRSSVHRGLLRAYADIAITRLPILIPAVFTPTAISAVTVAVATTTATTIAAASLGTPSIAVTAALTAFATAGLTGMLPTAIVAPLATAAGAMS